ncbi:MAG: arginine--tRNA ligase [Kiritimatiellae bacterium]|nr:arginine--tRNA ligase [Kiritimatiellia bacterium]
MNSGTEQLEQWLQAALEKAFGDAAAGTALRIQPATDPAFGDFQCNDAMGLARKLRKPPRAIAEAIVGALDRDGAPATAEIAGPGFINIRVDASWLAAELADATTLPAIGAGKTLVIDYSSPNVAKPMHIGHIRSTVIGNALHRIFKALGYNVVADNHIGDWGTQFGIIIKGYREFLDREALERDPIEELQRIYVESYGRTKAGDDATPEQKAAAQEWLDACRTETVKLQQGDPDNRALWREFIRLSLGEFDKIYARLGVKFDTVRGESYYQEQLAGVVESLERAGMAKESDGATIVDLTDDGLDVAIVRKRDGGFNYTTTDIATVATRIRDYNPDEVIYVTDERQQLHFKQFFRICDKLGLVPGNCKLRHVWFGLMRLPEGVISTRQGNLIKLETLLDEAEKRARAIIDASDKDLDDAAKAKLAAQIGVGAIKYADLSHDPQTMIVFTWDKALALEGNSGPYLQYAHARICSLLDKYRAAVPGAAPTAARLMLDEPAERILALQILKFPGAVVRAAESCRPNVLADYLYALSQSYSSFYQRYPILKADPAVRDSRAHLCELTARTLRAGLDLLGIEAPERI